MGMDAIIMLNKREGRPGHAHSHQYDSQDNCEGCQQERRENNMLVDFYERLNKIEGKVDRIRDGVTVQQANEHKYRGKLQEMGRLLSGKPQQALKRIKEHDSKEMGYELASALIQREIKTKQENQRLQAIIDQLQREKLKLQQEKKQQESKEMNRSSSQIRKKQHSIGSNRYSDVIDQVRRTNDSSYFLQKQNGKQMTNSYFGPNDAGRKYWEDTSPGQDETSFSNFTALKKEKSRSEERSTYQGLNLWLYQFKPQEIDHTPIKSLRRPNQNRSNAMASKARSKV